VNGVTAYIKTTDTIKENIFSTNNIPNIFESIKKLSLLRNIKRILKIQKTLQTLKNIGIIETIYIS